MRAQLWALILGAWAMLRPFAVVLQVAEGNASSHWRREGEDHLSQGHERCAWPIGTLDVQGPEFSGAGMEQL